MFKKYAIRKKCPQSVDFIRRIRTTPYLWDHSNAHFKDYDRKAQKWFEIARDFGLEDGKAAQQKWKNIVDTYRRVQRLIRNGQRKNVFAYDDEMAFMDVGDQRDRSKSQTPCINEQEDDIQDFHQFGLDSLIATAEEIQRTNEVEDEPIESKPSSSSFVESPSDAFGKMVALSLEQMEPKMRLQAQIEIQRVLFKCKYGEEALK